MTSPVDEGQAHWDAVYGSRKAEELSWFQDRPLLSLELIARTGKDRQSSIIDVGGGASRLVDALLDEGFQRVTVLDISAEALARAQDRLGDRARLVTWIAGDITRWMPPARYEVWHDRAVFHFLVDPEKRRAYEAALAGALPPGAQAIIGTFASDGPERCSGLPVARYEPDTLAAELGPGFRLLEGVHDDHVTPGGKVQHFQFSRLVRT
jgi:SAM-dependent methyltransferase